MSKVGKRQSPDEPSSASASSANAVSPGTGVYPCFDFALLTEIDLPELQSTSRHDWTGAIVTVRQGSFADVSASAAALAPELQVDGSRAVLTIPDVARFQISDGNDICVDPEPGVGMSLVRLFLLGSALGILSLQRGLFLLHANAVVIDGHAFAFAGHSGAGKSTLAGSFQSAGYPVLCDDVCGISFDDSGRPIAWPGLPRLKLWRDAAEALGHDPSSYDRVAEGHDKFQVPYTHADQLSAVPFAALYVLERKSDGEAGEITRLTGAAGMSAVMENSYRHQYLQPLGLAQGHFRQSAALIGRAGVFRAARRWGFDRFDEEVATLKTHAAAIASQGDHHE